MTKNKSKTLIWWDDEIKNSYLLCLEPYNLKLLKEVDCENKNETEITVYGLTEDVDRFIEDVEDDSLEPFETLSLNYEDCNEYYNTLKLKLNAFICCKNYENSSHIKTDWSKTW